MTDRAASSHLSLRVGELLLKEGFITKEDLQRALAIQARDEAQAQLPMGELMVQRGLISKEQLRTLLQHPDLRRHLGSLLVDEGLLNPGQLLEALKEKRPNEFLGSVLVRRNFLKRRVLEDFLVRQQEGIHIGELAFRLNMINRRDLDKALGAKRMPRTIGEILCDLELISSENLHYILKKYNKQVKLGEILLKLGRISEGDFQAALQEQVQTDETLGQVLVKKELITVDQLYDALSRQHNITFRRLEDFTFVADQKRSLIRIVGEKFAQRNWILPLALQDNRLLLALSRPRSLRALSELRPMFPELTMQPIFITEEKFVELATALYGRAIPGAIRPDSAAGGQDPHLVEIDLQAVEGPERQVSMYAGSDMMVEQVVDYIIKHGIISGASDIHLEQDRDRTLLRYRLDGVCQEHMPAWLNEKLQEMPGAIISRIKVMSNLDIAERRLPQDGVFRINYLDRASNKRFDLDFRVATCPAIVGENVTIRILDSRKAKVGLENLNHSENVLNPLKRLFSSAAGMVLVSGPTGSGKSSTLYGALQYIYNPGIKIITAEDPIEYSFPGIMQTQVKPKIGLTFSRLLRSFLRLDPDVILVGEVRDPETASIAFDAAQTGHLLLSTIHTNDAVSAVSRLLDLAIEPNQIAASLIGVLAQRLVRRNCSKCSRPYRPSRSEWRLFFREYPEHLEFHRGIGCKACGFSGYAGRTLISELFEVNRDIALAISTGVNEKQLKQVAFESGMKTMIDDGLTKLHQTTLSEIIRAVPIEMIKDFTARHAGAADGQGGAADYRITISDPDSQWHLIDRLYDKYATLRQATGEPLSSDDAPLFRRFVAEQHHSICRQYGCRQVEFVVEVCDQRTQMSARVC